MTWAKGILLFWLAVAIGADCLAHDRPLLAHVDGETHWLCHLRVCDGLAEPQPLARSMTADDWVIWPLTRNGPNSVRGTTGAQASQLREVLAGPSKQYWLGTDGVGRDVFARLVHGVRTTAWMALLAALLATLGGAVWAIVVLRLPSAFAGTILGAADIAMVIPGLLLVIAFQGLFGHGTILSMAVLIALPRCAATARILHGGLEGELRRDYCEAAAALGWSRWRILLVHALPNVKHHLRIAAAITAATAVLSEVALTYLGFGVPSPTPSWGELLFQATSANLEWWLVVPAGLATTSVAGALLAFARKAG